VLAATPAPNSLLFMPDIVGKRDAEPISMQPKCSPVEFSGTETLLGRLPRYGVIGELNATGGAFVDASADAAADVDTLEAVSSVVS
jgi:hypothetical protein